MISKAHGQEEMVPRLGRGLIPEPPCSLGRATASLRCWPAALRGQSQPL